MFSVLDKKLIRDVRKLWTQILAISLVLACGVSTIIIGVGAYRSLKETQGALYERYLFASHFAQIVRAPKHVANQIALLDNVIAVEPRIVKPAILDLAGMKEPASGLVTSLPENRELSVNRVYLREGRLPRSNAIAEVAVLDRFARAHEFRPGDRFDLIMNGKKNTVTIVGIVLSPEFIYVIGPGDMVPDDKRFAVLFFSEAVLASIYDMQGAFNNIGIRASSSADSSALIRALDQILRPYGSTGAHDRADQVSHAFLQSELNQLEAMARIIPPIFLFVAAFLVNMILNRLITLEREQIGLFKAMGYSNLQVGWHYAKLVMFIAAVGILIGSLFGFWAGRGLTRLYGDIFTFPFLLFHSSLDLYVIAGGISVAAALAGAARSIWVITTLPPAVAMRPPAPTSYHAIGLAGLQRLRILSRLTIMALRHLLRWPARTGLTILGTALSVALLITSLFSYDSLDVMINNIFFEVARQHATLTLNSEQHSNTLYQLKKLPGVLEAEAFRETPITVRNQNREERLSLSGVVPGADLSRVLDLDLQPISPLKNAVIVTERLLNNLKLTVGDSLDIHLSERDSRTVRLPIVGIAHSYVGLGAYTHIDTVNRLLRDGPRISGAHLLLDPDRLPEIYAEIKKTPTIASLALLGPSRANLEETINKNITTMTSVYVVLAIIITFGVIYNSARIQLSERARELASLRVFGFTRAEVSSVIITEIALIVLLAQPLGWLMGWLFAQLVVTGFASDLFRIPLVIHQTTYANASLLVLLAATISTLIVRRRIDRLNLVSVLKTRE